MQLRWQHWILQLLVFQVTSDCWIEVSGESVHLVGGSCDSFGPSRGSQSAVHDNCSIIPKDYIVAAEGKSSDVNRFTQANKGQRQTQQTKMSPENKDKNVVTVTPRLVIGTRIHLGKASKPPSDESLRNTIHAFHSLLIEASAVKGVIAVDGDDSKIPGYSLKETLSRMVEDVVAAHKMSDPDTTSRPTITMLPVTPWGNFIPALNAIVTLAASPQHQPTKATHLLFMSAETSLTKENVDTLIQHCSLEDTLVAGAVLPGHDYEQKDRVTSSPRELSLTGRTTPWNTAAVWNLPQLALTGFPLVAEGVHTKNSKDGTEVVPVAAGVEEVSAIALHQQIWTASKAKAKLIPLPNVKWTQTWTDEERQKWHEAKMNSKVERPAVHLDLLFGSRAACDAKVLHY
jgi:hypothetical protein